MFELLFAFYYDYVFYSLSSVETDYTSVVERFGDSSVIIFGQYFTIAEYLSLTASLITIIFIVVLCCLFIYKIIKLIGGLIR